MTIRPDDETEITFKGSSNKHSRKRSSTTSDATALPITTKAKDVCYPDQFVCTANEKGDRIAFAGGKEPTVIETERRDLADVSSNAIANRTSKAVPRRWWEIVPPIYDRGLSFLKCVEEMEDNDLVTFYRMNLFTSGLTDRDYILTEDKGKVSLKKRILDICTADSRHSRSRFFKTRNYFKDNESIVNDIFESDEHKRLLNSVMEKLERCVSRKRRKRETVVVNNECKTDGALASGENHNCALKDDSDEGVGGRKGAIIIENAKTMRTSEEMLHSTTALCKNVIIRNTDTVAIGK